MNCKRLPTFSENVRRFLCCFKVSLEKIRKQTRGFLHRTRGGATSKLIWVVSNIFYVHPYLGKWSNLTSIYQMGWNYQLVVQYMKASLRIEENLNYVDTSQYGNRCHLRNMSYAGRRLPVQARWVRERKEYSKTSGGVFCGFTYTTGKRPEICGDWDRSFTHIYPTFTTP